MKSPIGCCAAALLLGFVGAVSFAPTAPAQPEAATTKAVPQFDQFWARFRRALLTGDMEAVAAVTRLPLEVRGELDTDPAYRASRAALAGVLTRALNADTGLSLRQHVTNRALIERVETPTSPMPGVSVGATSARVGAFAFKRSGLEWQLCRVYLSGD
jgi:hypothetical protein